MKFNMLGDANHAGPVRLSDVYSSAVGSAKDGVAASQRALYDAYNSLNSRTTDNTSKISKCKFDAYWVSQNNLGVINIIDCDGNTIYMQIKSDGRLNMYGYNGTLVKGF